VTVDLHGVRVKRQRVAVRPGWQVLTVTAQGPAETRKFNVRARIDTPVELAYYQHGGILPYVLRQLTSRK